MGPPPGVAPSSLAYRASASLKMLWGRGKWSARGDLHAQGCLILSQVGLLFPVNHAPRSCVPDRLRSGDLLLEKQACWLDYTTGTEDGEGKRSCTFDLMHVTHPLWLAELCPQKWWGRRVLPSLPLACQASALLMSYVPGEPHPPEIVSPAGLSPVTWSLGHSRSVL